jgi:exopolysaccharide production protein ExoZ
LLGVAVAWLGFAYSGGEPANRLAAHAPAALLVVVAAMVLEARARRKPSRLGLFLGDASYSVYLAHPFGERLCFLVLAAIGASAASLGIIAVLVGVAAGLLAGLLVHLFIERPIMKAGKRLIALRGRRPARPSPIDNFPRLDDKAPLSRPLNQGAQCAARGSFAQEAIS